MDGSLVAVARDCLDAAYDGSRDFPDIVGTLILAGFEGYSVDYRRGITTYHHGDGSSVDIDNRPSDAHVALAFDQDGIVAQIRWAQSGDADYSYGAFCDNAKGAGCAGYIVSFPGRRVLYYGRTAETHVEHFPQ
jgi:uncharacterized protein YbcV (DUF1398 family)